MSGMSSGLCWVAGAFAVSVEAGVKGAGTVNEELHVGHAPEDPTRSVVAEIRWPHDGHSNRNESEFMWMRRIVLREAVYPPWRARTSVMGCYAAARHCEYTEWNEAVLRGGARSCGIKVMTRLVEPVLQQLAWHPGGASQCKRGVKMQTHARTGAAGLIFFDKTGSSAGRMRTRLPRIGQSSARA
jgi:hypothetical protein